MLQSDVNLAGVESGVVIDRRYRWTAFLGKGTFGAVFAADRWMLNEVAGHGPRRDMIGARRIFGS
jgi:hypothetical protein